MLSNGTQYPEKGRLTELWKGKLAGLSLDQAKEATNRNMLWKILTHTITLIELLCNP